MKREMFYLHHVIISHSSSLCTEFRGMRLSEVINEFPLMCKYKPNICMSQVCAALHTNTQHVTDMDIRP